MVFESKQNIDTSQIDVDKKDIQLRRACLNSAIYKEVVNLRLTGMIQEYTTRCSYEAKY
jgi:hypothetical protein